MSNYEADLTRWMVAWWTDEFLPEFYEKYGKDAEIAVVILRNDVALDWTTVLRDDAALDWADPFEAPALVLTNVEDFRRRELLDNVGGKLRFVLRTGRSSADARHRPDLLEPRDFPFEGAGTYMNRTGGASGLMEESDWWVFKRVVEKYNKLRAELTAPAVQACANRDRSLAYNPDKFLLGLEIT